jgi:hypothetical protein
MTAKHIHARVKDHPFSDCREDEVLHLRFPLYGPAYELAPGYYVLREVLSFQDSAGISYSVVSQAGEDENGQMIIDGDTYILRRHALEQLVGIGIRARETFIARGG